MNDIIERGKLAWARIKDRGKLQAEDWFLVGAALLAGRSECLKLARTNSLHSPHYRLHIRRWLNDNGFGDLDGGARDDAMWAAENKAKVTRWLDGLDEVSRRNANHPSTIISHMKRGTEPSRRGPKGHVVKSSKPQPATRPAQDIIRKVADAMRCSGKQDWLLLACVAIESLSAEDLLHLLGKDRAPAQFMDDGHGQHVHA